MSTQQSPTVLLVDLAERASGFQRALAQLGIATRRATKEQVRAIFDSTPPRGVIATAESSELLVTAVRSAGLPNDLPVFVLSEDEDAPVRGRGAREITAVVPQDVDPGVLGLRLKTALQHSRAPKQERHPTLMGFGDSAESQAVSEAREAAREAMASVLSFSQPAPSQRPPAPPGSRASSRRPGRVGAGQRPAGAAGVGTQNASVRPSSSPELNPFDVAASGAGASAQPRRPLPSDADSVHTSAPPIPSSHPPRGSLSSNLFTMPENPVPKNIGQTIPGGFVFEGESEAAAPRAAAQAAASVSGSSAPSRPAPAPGALEPTVPFHATPDTSSGQPVTTSLRPDPSGMAPDFAAVESQGGAGRGKWLRYGGAALVVVVVGGLTAALSGPGDPSDAAPLAKSAAVQDGATPQEVLPKVDEKKPSEAADTPQEPSAEAAVPEPEDEDAVRFKIKGAASLENCEALLGKKPEDFASKPQWHAATAWKQARKNLMAGKQDAANELMCKAAFIDPSGPATTGLVKFYLGARALDQAQALAERGIEKGSGSNRELKELLGDVFSQRGEVDKARELWLETMKLTADDTKRLEPVVRNFVKIASKARKGGDTALAERLLRRAAAFEPDNPAVAAEFAVVLQKNEQPELAQRWAKHALELDKESELAQEVLNSL